MACRGHAVAMQQARTVDEITSGCWLPVYALTLYPIPYILTLDFYPIPCCYCGLCIGVARYIISLSKILMSNASSSEMHSSGTLSVG